MHQFGILNYTLGARSKKEVKGGFEKATAINIAMFLILNKISEISVFDPESR